MGFPSSLAIISTPVKSPKTCKIKPNVPCAFNSVVYLTLIRTLQPLFLSLKDCNRKARINRLSNLSERYNENARKNKDKGIRTEKNGKKKEQEGRPTLPPTLLSLPNSQDTVHRQESAVLWWCWCFFTEVLVNSSSAAVVLACSRLQGSGEESFSKKV